MQARYTGSALSDRHHILKQTVVRDLDVKIRSLELAYGFGPEHMDVLKGRIKMKRIVISCNVT